MIRTDLFQVLDASQALQQLKEGNQRYLDEGLAGTADCSPAVRQQLADQGQAPFAVVLSCSDSRVPPELVFDVGVGQIFVVRTAGNVVDAITIGSVEYAVQHLGCQLVLVLGHSQCGAVAAAISGGDHGPNIGAVISEIEPSLASLPEDSNINILCEDQNIRHTISRLEASQALGKPIAEGRLAIVGAKYDLASGQVDFWS